MVFVMLATNLSIPFSSWDAGFFLTNKTFLWYNAHLNCTNYKGKYLRLKYYKKVVLYIHCIGLFALCLFIFTEKICPRHFRRCTGYCTHTTKKACGYQCHTLAVLPSPKFTAPLVGSIFGIQSEVCGGAFLSKPLTCQAHWLFLQRSFVVDVWLNSKCDTLSKEVFTTGITQGNLEFPLPPNFVDSHLTQKQKDELLDWLHVLISLGELIHWVDKTKIVWLIVG